MKTMHSQISDKVLYLDKRVKKTKLYNDPRRKTKNVLNTVVDRCLIEKLKYIWIEVLAGIMAAKLY